MYLDTLHRQVYTHGLAGELSVRAELRIPKVEQGSKFWKKKRKDGSSDKKRERDAAGEKWRIKRDKDER